MILQALCHTMVFKKSGPTCLNWERTGNLGNAWKKALFVSVTLKTIWGWQLSAWQMYGFWGWQMSKFGGGKCPIYGDGKCPPGKCLTIPLYYGKVQISNKFLKCGQCCAFQKCNQTTLVSACLRTKPPKNSIHPETRHIQPINDCWMMTGELKFADKCKRKALTSSCKSGQKGQRMMSWVAVD